MITGPFPKRDVTLLLGHAGVVAGDGHLGDEGDVGFQAEGADPGAFETHLLLHGADGVDGGLDVLVLEPLQRRHHHDDAGPVVEALAGDEVVGQGRHGGVDRDGRADLDTEGGGVVGVGGAHVDEHVLDLARASCALLRP